MTLHNNLKRNHDKVSLGGKAERGNSPCHIPSFPHVFPHLWSLGARCSLAGPSRN